ncbi:type II 3-dehydroquinate dehydratase [Mycolicibacterium septicum]|uniref:type II 3-dehydroquinate dehydratase n=1 Tax=Mycolicibacterium septicum TaxID=98668 RepID=UPI0023E16C84|nr:type II 3-dehydroquinate dehydratase [Mycolicibacterium septicum]MDF3337117.1 type II 3-dehydroquinate dehydratase [Mycolicibacterium septicum]
MHYLVLQGPNLNRLGKRDPRRYGNHTLAQVEADIADAAAELGVTVQQYQSNHEGCLIDFLQERQDTLDGGIIVNPAGLTKAGYSLATALADTELPVAVVHLSQLFIHDPGNRHDVFASIATVYIAGAGWRGYRFALQTLHSRSL